MRRREFAAASGQRFIVGTKPCKRGHTGPHYASDGSCVECAKQRAISRYSREGSTIRKQLRAAYAKHPDEKRERVKAHRKRYPERVKASARAKYERKREVYRRKARAWELTNKERKAALNKAWRVKHPDAVAYRAAAARADRYRRTPAWLTRAQRRQIRAMYARAIERTKSTGVKHNVDHIVPLRGETVSGLHVPWNLQILTAFENRSKSNRVTQ